MKFYPLLFLLYLGIGVGVIGCQRVGCAEQDAINYDPEVKTDDGTCVFPSEVIAAYYNYNDTITRQFANFPDSVEISFPAADSFYFGVNNTKSVYWKNYVTCNDSIPCSITQDLNLSLANNFNCGGEWKDLAGKLTGNVLRYTYKIEKADGVTEQVNGTAIKYR